MTSRELTGMASKPMAVPHAATTSADTGVRTPLRRPTPPAISRITTAAAGRELAASPRDSEMASAAAVSPTAARSSSRPTPGQRAGKVEKSRCRCAPSPEEVVCSHGTSRELVANHQRLAHPPNPIVVLRYPTRGSQLDDAPPNRDGDRLGTVARAELVHDVLHVHLDRLFRNRQLVGDIAIAVAAGDA